MIPNVGDVYCVYAEKLQQYTACQVIRLKEMEGKPSDTLAFSQTGVAFYTNSSPPCLRTTHKPSTR